MQGNQFSITKRPQVLSEVHGHIRIKDYFYNLVKDKKPFPNAVLFNGLYGTGKTTFAKIVAKMIQCKNPLPNGDPCCECPSCKSIQDETWGRDVLMIDGGQTSKAEVIDQITSFISTPPMRDKAKIVIIEEVQELSTAAKNSMLKILEVPRSNTYFLFTAMENLKGSGFVSRCQNFRFSPASIMDIMVYLKGIMESENLWASTDIPKEFKIQGLQAIASNCNGSYRAALQMLEQCLDSKCFTAKELEQEMGIIDQLSFYEMMLRMLNGEADENMFETLFSGDFLAQFNLSYKVIADAYAYKIFKKIEGPDWAEKQAAQLSSHPNFDILRNGYVEISNFGANYLKRATYMAGVCEIIEKCRNAKQTTTQPTRIVETTPIVQNNSTPVVNKIEPSITTSNVDVQGSSSVPPIIRRNIAPDSSSINTSIPEATPIVPPVTSNRIIRRA